jgi:hypothetical protein
LKVLDRFRIVSCICERRGKGQIFKCEDRLEPSRLYIMRKINLETCNAGKDDGLPTSILREVALLKALSAQSHPNLQKIAHCEVLSRAEPNIDLLED